jgi:hypothetical protein
MKYKFLIKNFTCTNAIFYLYLSMWACEKQWPWSFPGCGTQTCFGGQSFPWLATEQWVGLEGLRS